MSTCMGGFCRVRDKCKHYGHKPLQVPIERLCEPNDFDAFEPLIFTRAAGTWERKGSGLAPATWHEAIA